MPLSAPTYSAAYSQSEQNANAVTLTGFTAATNAALLAWITAVEKALEIAVADHPETASPLTLQNPLVGPLKAAYATLVTALS